MPSRDAHEIITERYRAGSMIFTSNRGTDEWLPKFADPMRHKVPSIAPPATLTTWSSKANLTGRVCQPRNRHVRVRPPTLTPDRFKASRATRALNAGE
jgi:hypothetical protein